MFKLTTKTENSGDNDKGSILILVALCLTAFLGLCAFVTDFGVIAVNKSNLQNTLDTAVLAGAQELPSSTTNAQQVAEQYALQNGVSQITIDFAHNNSEISASTQKQVPALFSKVLGIQQNTVTASSGAIVLPPTSLTGAVPFSIQEQVLTYGTLYDLKSGGGDGDNGWYGALALSCPGANSYQDDLTHGYSGTLSIGQILDIQTGNMSGPTKTAIDDRLAADTREPRNTYDDYERNAPELVYVPVVKLLESGQVQIVGFAAFFLEGTTGNGNDSTVQGRFLQTIVVNGQSTGSLADLQESENLIEQDEYSSNFGLYATKLLH
ncbi:MAG: TadE/TadG family type IV pilus assembly protein [Desulfitobacteriaceae bacterium]